MKQLLALLALVACLVIPQLAQALNCPNKPSNAATLATVRFNTTDGHQAVVKDNKGTPDTIYEGLANGANFIDERSFGAEYSGPRRVVGGLAVTTLGSGKLYIYLA